MKRKGFTLIELIAVLIILAILSLVVVPLVLNIIKSARNSANKRSVDGYGRAVDLAIANYLVEHLTYPESFDKLEIEYSGSKVECKTSRINPDETVYLSECKVNGRLVKDNKNIDGYYHYGILKMTNQEYVDAYGKNLEDALKAYHDEHNEYPSDYTTLILAQLDKEVSCDVETYSDGKIYLTKCSVDTEEVLDETQEDGYYHYGKQRPIAVQYLVNKANGIEIDTYTNGNTHEMYTFEHSATEQTGALTDYRYIGNDPYNYVTFNNELWRIIGVFTVDDGTGNLEQSIKIVKNENLSNNMSWNSSNTNDWTTASLKTYLNGEYYNRIDKSSQDMIIESKFYLGAIIGHDNLNGEIYYNYEHSTNLFPARSINWIGKIALMYPSDYSYTYALGIDNTCYNDGFDCGTSSGKINGWIYNTNSNSNQWLLPYRFGYGSDVFRISDSGGIALNYASISYGIRPTLYLKSDIVIKSGYGSIDLPYEFEL